jgi:hypothetical protein
MYLLHVRKAPDVCKGETVHVAFVWQGHSVNVPYTAHRCTDPDTVIV